MGTFLTKAVAIAALASLAVACSTINPYTGEQQTSKAAKGAAIGAAGGAVVGLLTKGDALDNALIGAAIGGIAGGSVGYYMDVQEAKLRERMAGTGVTVTRTGKNKNDITLNMPGNITFATASSDLNPDFFKVLDGVAMVLKEYDKTVIEIAGHTDSRGSDEYNQALSERRAGAVAAYLVSRQIPQQRFITVGGGERYPVASNDTAEGQAQNRRVEITITPVVAG